MIPRVVLTWVTTARGGAECSVGELAENLARLGPEVDVVWWRSGGPPPPVLSGVRVHAVDNWAAYRETVAQVAQDDGRGTVVISSHRTAAADVRIAPWATVIPVVRHVVNRDQVLRVICPYTGKMIEKTIGALPWDLLRSVPVWVGISQASSAALRQHAPLARFVTTVHNGVTIPEKVPEGLRPATGRLRLAAVARTVPWKRVDALVHAVADPRISTSVSLDVYGEPGSHQEELDSLVRRLSAPVRFMNYSDDLPRSLAGYDLLVSASTQEGFGRFVVDAAGAGVPSLVPNTGASPELVLDGLTGLIYDAADPSGLVSTIAEALLNRAALPRMGSAARALAEAWYTPGRCAAQYLTLVAGQRPARPVLESAR